MDGQHKNFITNASIKTTVVRLIPAHLMYIIMSSSYFHYTSTPNFEKCALQGLFIDIPYRDSSDSPNGIVYQLYAEGCTAGFDNEDIQGIFEEHYVYQTIDSWHCRPTSAKGVCGIYIIQEKKFFLPDVLIGCQAKARFKLMNTKKVC